MSILVYTESEKNEFKKSALEALSYAKALGEKMNETVTCVSINCTDSVSYTHLPLPTIYSV